MFYINYYKSISIQSEDGVPLYNVTSKRSKTINVSECRLMVESELKEKIYTSTFCTFVDYKKGLVYDDSDSLFLIDNHLAGIASWNSKNHSKIKQFTRISSYLGWIKSQISPSISIKL